MRIATLVTGAPRTIHRCAASIKSLIDTKHQQDVFVNVWGDEVSDDAALDILRQLDPVVYDFPKTINWDWIRDALIPIDPNSYDVRTIYSRAWSNYKANLMRLKYEREHGFTYDAIAFLRTDIIYGIDNFDPEPFLTTSKQVLMSTHHTFGYWSDQFIICKDEAATHYANMVLWMLGELPMTVATAGILEPEVGKHSFCNENNVKVWMTRNGNYERVLQDIPHKIVRARYANASWDEIPYNDTDRDIGYWL
jgi:hypothetical protein